MEDHPDADEHSPLSLFVIIEDNSKKKMLTKLTPGKQIRWNNKHSLKLGEREIEHLPSNFKVQEDGSLAENTSELIGENVSRHIFESDASVQGDNEEIYDRNEETQTLTAEAIKELKQKLSGAELVNEISKGNKNFVKKSEFTQQKYIEKKKRKHMLQFRIEKVSLPSLINYFIEHKNDYIFPREDYFAQFISAFDIEDHNRILIAEKSTGAVLAALLMKIQPTFNGQIYMLDPKSNADAKKYEAVKFLGIQNWKNHVTFLKKGEEFEANLDYVGFAFDSSEKEILQLTLPKLNFGGTLVVFTRHVEVARAIVDHLLQLKNYIHIKVSDYFYREYQVLPLRTHPTMKGNTCGGFIITALKVAKVQEKLEAKAEMKPAEKIDSPQE